MAVKTRAELITESNNTFKDTPAGNITPPNHRAFNNDLIDSMGNLNDSNTFVGNNTFQAPAFFNGGLNTAYTEQGAAETINLGNYPNFINLLGDAEITSFGVAPQGAWRYLRFNNNGSLIVNSAYIQTPSNADIEVNAGDTCLAYALETDIWIIVNYQRADGKPLNADTTISPFYYQYNIVPDATYDDTKGYKKGQRFLTVLGDGTYKEYLCVKNDTQAAKWIPMAGTMGVQNCDINVPDIEIFSDGQTLGPYTTNIRYQIHGNLMTISGMLGAVVNATQSSPDVIIQFSSISNSDAELVFVLTGDGGPTGMVNASQASQILDKYYYSVGGTQSDLVIELITENPHWGNVSLIAQFVIVLEFKLTP
jgi:hypothetical protein